MAKDLRAFIPENTATAKKLSTMSAQQIFERYFIDDNGISWSKDFYRERTKLNDNVPVYGLISSLNGIPLQTIVTVIRDNVVTYVPVGYKLNSKAIVRDLEAILTENRADTMEAAQKKLENPSEMTTDFIIELAYFLSKIFIDGIKYYDNVIYQQ